MKGIGAAGLTTILFLSACGGLGIDWRRHISLRAYGAGIQLSEIDADEAAKAAVRPRLDYVSISVERIYFKNVPVALTGAVAVGMEVSGLAPGNETVRTVLGVKSVGLDRVVRFDDSIVLQPTLYTGREVTLRLHFRKIPGNFMQAALGRIQGVSDLLKKIDPALPKTLEAPLQVYQQVIEGPASTKEPMWSYQTTFLPVGVIRDKPDRIFTAARHILVLMPPSGHSSPWGKLRSSQLPKFLKMEGSRLVWRHNGHDYEATPHIIVNVRRYRRYPRETEVEKHIRRADVLYEQGTRGGFFTLGRIALMSAAEAVVEDQILTQPEKNLVREWIRFRHRRYDAEEARSKGEKRKALDHMYGQVRALGVIRQEFRKILYPFEVKDIEYKVTTLASRIQEAAKALGETPERLDKLLTVYKLKERVVQLLKVKYKDRVIRVHSAKAEQFGAPPGEKNTISVGKADVKVVDIAKEALANPPPNASDLESGISEPFYKKWWFWTLVSVGVTGAAAGTILGLRSDYRGGGSVTGPIAPLPQSLRRR